METVDMDAKGRYRKKLAKAIKKMQTTESKTHKPKSDDRGTTAQAEALAMKFHKLTTDACIHSDCK